LAITSTGIGSGLDVEGIVAQLMEVERQPLTRLQTSEAGIQAEISSVGSLRSALDAFRDAADALADPATFTSSNPSVSDDAVLSVTADTDASPGSFAVEVLRLAENHRMASGPKAPDATVGGTAGDTLEITVGEQTLTVDLSEARTLAQIRDLINSDFSGVGVSAALLTVDAGGEQRLTINARETGYENRLQLAFGGTLQAADFGFETLNKDGAGQTLNDLTKLDASLSIDGFGLTRGSNRIDDVVDGLTLELSQVGTASVNLAQDDVPIVQALSGLVDNYNTLKARVDELSLGNLSGDSLLRSITGSVRSVINRAFNGFGDFAQLSELGISTTEEGDLAFEAGRLTEALSANRAGVVGFFSAETGFGAALSDALGAYLDEDGFFDTRIEGLSRQVGDLQDQQLRWQDRLIDIEDRYRRQFNALDSLVAQLLTTSNFLTQQLDNLPGFTFDQGE